jgi:hypothetical protein
MDTRVDADRLATIDDALRREMLDACEKRGAEKSC